MNDYTNLMRIVAVTPGIDLGNLSELKATLKRLGVLGRSVKGRPEPKIHEENFQIITKAIQSSTFTNMGIGVRDSRNQFIANMNDSGDFGTYGQIINGSGLTSNNKKYARNLVDFTDNKEIIYSSIYKTSIPILRELLIILRLVVVEKVEVLDLIEPSLEIL